jgi:hypothetical protein
MSDKPDKPADAPAQEVAETDPEMLRILVDHEIERGSTTTTRVIRSRRKFKPITEGWQG